MRENCGEKPFGIIGENTGEWVVMDYGDVWVHIFLPPIRERYRLEELWSDAKIIEIAEL